MTKSITAIIIIFLGVLFIFPHFSCHPGDNGNKEYPDTVHLVNWNIAFTPSSNGSSADIITAIEDSLTKYVQAHNADTRLIFIIKSCPCDTSLLNLDATVIYGSGQTVPTPPTQPKPGPSGDYLVEENFKVYNPEFKDSTYQDTSTAYTSPINIQAAPVSSRLHKVLAVIDTGLDTLRFNQSFPNTVWNGNLLWQDGANETLFNVMPGEPEHVLIDNTNVKHGTAVTEIVLKQVYQLDKNSIPQIMSIRAFDSNEQGTVYTVSCALSYAIQHHADFINASWGYFGKENPVLKKYVQRASDSAIRIIAAAGNSPFPHDGAQVCSVNQNNLNSLNRLERKDSLFYPACFAPTIANLVSVTQLHQTNTSPGPLELKACYYQNFSPDFITVGAFDKHPSGNPPCCIFNLPFLSKPIEGSSFATPVLTAILMKSIQNKSEDIKLFINREMPKTINKDFTLNGNYYVFIQEP
jgi:hypothetical protein